MRSAADVARDRGWQPGDVLQKTNKGRPEKRVVQITAVGTTAVLIRECFGERWTSDCLATKSQIAMMNRISHTSLSDAPRPEWFV